MNTLKIFFTICLLSFPLNTVQAMDGDEVEKEVVFKRATFTNSTQRELWVRLLKSDTDTTQLFCLRGFLKRNEPRIIEESGSEKRNFTVILSYEQNYMGAVMVPLETLRKDFEVSDEGAGLILREMP